jgi:hypothetical protein
VLIALRVSPLAAQETHRGVWLSAGIGSGAVRDRGDGISAVGQLSLQSGRYYLTTRGVLIVDPFDSDANGAGELGLLFGPAFAKRWGRVTVATGLSLTTLEQCGEDDPDHDCLTTGIPLMVEATVRPPWRVAGLGLQAFLNANTAATYGGAAVMLHLGWIP